MLGFATRLLATELSDVAFSKTQNEWKHILFGEFCYTPHQGWLQNQAWGSLLMLTVIIIIITVSLASISFHLFLQQSVLDRLPGHVHCSDLC